MTKRTGYCFAFDAREINAFKLMPESMRSQYLIIAIRGREVRVGTWCARVLDTYLGRKYDIYMR